MVPTPHPHDACARIIGWISHYRIAVLMLAIALAIHGTVRTVRLYTGLRSELEELLPASSPAVAAVNTLRTRMPGSQHLGVIVRGPPGVPGEFVAGLAASVRKYPPELVRLVRIDVAEERRFIRDHASLY